MLYDRSGPHCYAAPISHAPGERWPIDASVVSDFVTPPGRLLRA
jgi:hypothetical protein